MTVNRLCHAFLHYSNLNASTGLISAGFVYCLYLANYTNECFLAVILYMCISQCKYSTCMYSTITAAKQLLFIMKVELVISTVKHQIPRNFEKTSVHAKCSFKQCSFKNFGIYTRPCIACVPLSERKRTLLFAYIYI